MKISIVYTSRTGNTALLAERVHACLPGAVCFGPPSPEAADADFIFVGFWTDKGTCDSSTASFLQGLRNKQVVLFGTAGFGGDPAYFAQILDRAAANLDRPSNTLVDSFMCQGKMPAAVRRRYEAMAAADPAQAAPMLENFDHALSHPDKADLTAITAFVKKLQAEGRL